MIVCDLVGNAEDRFSQNEAHFPCWFDGYILAPIVYQFLLRTSWSLLIILILKNLRPCHTLPDSANGRVTDNKILCPFVSVRMRFLSVPHAVNAFRVR